MADRLDFRTSVTAVKVIAASGEALGASVLSADIKGSLGGGNSSATWAGSNTDGWIDGVHTALTSAAGSIATGATCDGVFIKHTGYDFADGTTVNTSDVTISVAGPIVIATLSAGEAIFLPRPASTTITLGGGGTAAAVQYAIFT